MERPEITIGRREEQDVALSSDSRTSVEEGESLIAEIVHWGGPHPDPYPIYRRLREIAPVFRSERLGQWVVTGYPEVVDLHVKHREYGVGVNANLARNEPRYERSSYFQFIPRMTPWIDPPQHTRLRNLFAPAFTPRRINVMQEFIRTRVDELIDDMEASGSPDFIREVAIKLPIASICHLLGLPGEAERIGIKWAQSMAEAILSVRAVDESVLAIANESVSEGSSYLGDALNARRADPKEDLLTALVQAENDGDRLSEDEATAISYQLFIAASETTVGLLGLGLAALLENPEQLEKLRRSPELDGPAIEELLRFSAPTQMNMRRHAYADTELGGFAIKAGDVLMPFNAAANRDPAVFADPDSLDIARQGPPHMSFGRGIHMCVGAPLARLQSKIAIRAMIERYPQLSLAAEPVLRGAPGLRGVAELRLSLN
jgi:cytochrome P450